MAGVLVVGEDATTENWGGGVETDTATGAVTGAATGGAATGGAATGGVVGDATVDRWQRDTRGTPPSGMYRVHVPVPSHARPGDLGQV